MPHKHTAFNIMAPYTSNIIMIFFNRYSLYMTVKSKWLSYIVLQTICGLRPGSPMPVALKSFDKLMLVTL